MLDKTAKIIQTICPYKGGKWGWPRDLVSLLKINDIYSKGFDIVECNYIEDEKYKFDYKFNFKGIPVYLGNLELFKKDVKKYLDDKYTVILFANTEIQAERLKSIFENLNPSVDKFNLKINDFSILPLTLSGGFISDEKKVFFLNDYEIFGKIWVD